MILAVPSQPAALHLCSQLQSQGVKTTVGMLPAVQGYQVTVYQCSLADVTALLSQLGIDFEAQ
jgi:hypothetical protein